MGRGEERFLILQYDNNPQSTKRFFSQQNEGEKSNKIGADTQFIKTDRTQEVLPNPTLSADKTKCIFSPQLYSKLEFGRSKVLQHIIILLEINHSQ